MDPDPEVAAIKARLARELAERQAAPPDATPAPGVVDVTEATLPRVVTENRVVLVDCWAAWCGPCQTMAPVVEQLGQELAGQAVVAKLDVDANPRVAAALGVRSIPTFVVFKDGRPADRLVGVVPKSALAAAVRRHTGARGVGRPGPRR